MKYLILTFCLILTSFASFSQNNLNVLDSTYSYLISEEFYKKLGDDVILKSKFVCCTENPDSVFDVFEIGIPTDFVYYDENVVDYEDYYSNILSEKQISILTDHLIRKVMRSRKSLHIVDDTGVVIYTCLEMFGDFKTKVYRDNSIAVYGTLNFKIYFNTKLKP